MFLKKYKINKKGKEELGKLYKILGEKTDTFFGYPCNADFDYSELTKFLDFSINNVGDPFSGSNYQVNTRKFEKEVLRFFAELMHIKKEDFWGYMTNGGSEGNFYGLYLGRELFPTGIFYFSEDSHYSIPKATRILNVKNITVPSQKNGEIDYGCLEKALKKNRKMPAIISANIGTTVKGAVDNIENIIKIIKKNKIKDYYIHADAAFFGMILPFIKNSSIFDFRMPISSISISGHKMIGSPIPCGVVLVKKKLVKKIEKPVEYVGILDNTLSGSRNGFTPLILWYAIKKYGKKGFGEIIKTCLVNSDYALERFKKIGWPAWKNKNSIIIIIKKPSNRIVKKLQLAIQGEIAHLIIMPHITKKKIDKIIKDFRTT
ncbi:MAG: histidine decarboxylase [Candidatus Pacebacteria bacterium]|nr:histidine decarboxylase [Candidatus Paceibacterota bacterium]